MNVLKDKWSNALDLASQAQDIADALGIYTSQADAFFSPQAPILGLDACLAEADADNLDPLAPYYRAF
jgi:hypothetical protein